MAKNVTEESTKMQWAKSRVKEPLNYDKLESSLSKHYDDVLEANRKALEEVAKRKGYTKAQVEKIDHTLVLACAIDDLDKRIEMNSRTRESNAQEDTRACEFQLTVLERNANKLLDQVEPQYNEVVDQIERNKKNTSTKRR
jgi:hypothetical protein